MPSFEFFECSLHDGTSTGRVEFVDRHTGLSAIRIPRNLLPESGSFEHVKNAGVYFLFGPDHPTDIPSAPFVYVGKADVRENGKGVLGRVLEHYRDHNKDFFTYAIFLTRSDDGWDSADLSHLEFAFYQMAKTANRYKLKNLVAPPQGVLSMGRKQSLEKDQVLARRLLAMLGEHFTIPRDERDDDDGSIADMANRDIYRFKRVKDAPFSASGRFVMDGFVVLKGSTISPSVSASAKDWIIRRRDENQHVINPDFMLKKSISFSSPSAAASFVVGHQANGWNVWKAADGRTLGEVERSASTNVLCDGV